MFFFQCDCNYWLLCTPCSTVDVRNEGKQTNWRVIRDNCTFRWYNTNCAVGLMSREKLKVKIFGVSTIDALTVGGVDGEYTVD